jgi:hypothetical protein
MKLIARLTKENVTVAQVLKPGHGLNRPINNWGNINGDFLYYGMAYIGLSRPEIACHSKNKQDERETT